VRTYSVPWRANGRCTTAEYGLYPNGTVSILNTVELYGQPGQLLTSALVIGPGILAISGPSNPRSRLPHLKRFTKFLLTSSKQVKQTTSFWEQTMTTSPLATPAATTEHTQVTSLGFFQEIAQCPNSTQLKSTRFFTKTKFHLGLFFQLTMKTVRKSICRIEKMTMNKKRFFGLKNSNFFSVSWLTFSRLIGSMTNFRLSESVHVITSI
jgi:hypothetical protein